MFEFLVRFKLFYNEKEKMSSLDGTGLGVILAFYALVAGVGIWAGWRNRGKGDDHRNGHIVGARDINMGKSRTFGASPCSHLSALLAFVN